MSLFSFLTREVAIDLGTANSIIIFNDKVVVDEPSIVAKDRRTNKIIAIGKKAMQMHGRTHQNIETIRPLRDGVIADFETANQLIRELIKMINVRKSLIPPSLKMVICIPSGITNVEERAVRDSAEQAGAKEVKLIHEPMAAAIGIGIDVLEPVGNMIVDIGGGTSEIAVIALGGIVCNKSIRIAGDEFNQDIIEYMRKQHNINIGERMAEQIKISVGAAIPDLDVPPEDFAVQGRDVLTGIPKEILVNYKEIA
ncbi:MAG TPA: rod shape-determining protein, partial [Bacteroidales bacterium]|nr:rod shape-determining protein [Bacteroidales bacterium]